MKIKLRSLASFFSLVFCTVVAGCLLPESNHVEPDYYLLSESEIEQNVTSPKTNVSFYLREIELPRYLKDSRMIYRPSVHTLSFRESKRWGEPLEDGIARVVSLNLQSALDGAKFSIFPNRRKDGLQWDLSISFSAFEMVGKDVIIEAKWFAKGSQKTTRGDSFSAKFPLSEMADEVEEIEVFNMALAQLAGKISTSFRAQ